MLLLELNFVLNEFLKLFSGKRPFDAQKNTVLIAIHASLKVMEKQKRISNDFVANPAIKLLFGSRLMSKSSMNRLGFGYGLKKAIPFDAYLIYPATVNSNLNKSKMTGLNKLPGKILISLKSSISFTMGLISKKIIVSFLL